MSLDGDDSFASADGNTTTMFIFSDTLTGTSDKKGKIYRMRMPNHSAAVLQGDAPDPDKITFVMGRGGNGNTALDCNGAYTNNGGTVTTNDGSESGMGMGGPMGGQMGGMAPGGGQVGGMAPGGGQMGGTPPGGGRPDMRSTDSSAAAA